MHLTSVSIGLVFSMQLVSAQQRGGVQFAPHTISTNRDDPENIAARNCRSIQKAVGKTLDSGEMASGLDGLDMRTSKRQELFANREVVCRFNCSEKGYITELKVFRSSSDNKIDEQALSILKRSQPFLLENCSRMTYQVTFPQLQTGTCKAN